MGPPPLLRAFPSRTRATITSVLGWTWRARRPRVVSLAAPPAAWSPPWRAGASRSRRVAIDSRNASSACRGVRHSDAAKADESPLLDPRPPEEGVPGAALREPLAVRRRRAPRLRPERGHHVRHAPPQLRLRRQVSAGRAPLCRRQRGVGPAAVGKFGTPKCELVCQLLRCEEPENAPGGVVGGGTDGSAIRTGRRR